MDLNIDQLDSEERKKINALLRERNDTNKNKGVEYIFRQGDEREEFLLGKKIDLNKMAKDEKALMGESEVEFQERMEKRKLLQKMREDPMAIIQLNEQQAQKVAVEKKLVHQKLSKKYHSKFQRNQSESSSDSDSSDCLNKLRELLEKHVDNDNDSSIKTILSQVAPKKPSELTPNRNYEKLRNSNHKKTRCKRTRSRSNRRKSRSVDRNKCKSKRRHTSKSEDRRCRLSPENNLRKHDGSPKRKEISSKIREHESEKKYRRPIEQKSKLSKEEKEKRLQEMRENARAIDSTFENLDRKFKSQDEKEAIEIKRNLKHKQEYMMKEIVKLSNNKFSLENNIKERNRHSKMGKFYKG